MSDLAILLALALSLLLAFAASAPHAPASPHHPVAATGDWANEGFTFPAGCAAEPPPAPDLAAGTD